MATPFHLHIMTPEREFFDGNAEGVIVTVPDGELCVMAGHMPLLTPLNIGIIRINLGGEWKHAFISDGFMEVSHKETIIITQACEWPEDIDAARAEEVKRRAAEKLRQQVSTREYVMNKAALARAMARLRVKGSIN
ncbi:MAG: ATP synthase F1 subunit epsilon [Oscillospiraceae bacterium]|jgi:F-type H+-transporting ATPase subunit epsilon|nr:ATP synthase F1 subunit epsilon [Oscillospiraceae bacterium]